MIILSEPLPGEVVLLGYSRISNQDREREISIEIQNDRLSRAGVHRLYWDQESGDNDDRPEYVEMLRDAETIRIKFAVEIVACRLDRLGRNDKELERVIEWLEKRDIKFRALDGGYYGTENIYDWMRLKHESMMAQYWIRQTSLTRRSRMQEKRRHQQPTVGRPSRGYKFNKDNTKLELDPETAPVVRSWFEMYINGASMREISKVSGLSPGGVRNMLINPVYRGHLWYTQGGRTSKQVVGKHKMPKQIIYNTHDALITQSEWEAIQRKLEENRRLWGNHFSSHKRYPLQGLVVCGVCDRRMTTREGDNGKTSKIYRHMYCRYVDCENKKWLSYPDLESAAQYAILTKSRELAQLINQGGEGLIDPRILEIQEQISQLQALVHITGISEAIQELEVKIQQIESEAGFNSTEELETLARSLQDADWDALNDNDRRQIYQELIKKLIANDGSVVEVMLRF